MPSANPRNSPRSLCAVRSAGSVPGRSPAAVRQPVPGSMPPRLCWPVWPCCYIRLMQASHDVTVKQSQLQQAQEDNVALGVAYEKAFDQSAVKAAAQAAGMTKPTTDQIEYIELGGADMAEICRPESTGPLAQAWNWVKNGVDAVVEYFR